MRGRTARVSGIPVWWMSSGPVGMGMMRLMSPPPPPSSWPGPGSGSQRCVLGSAATRFALLERLGPDVSLSSLRPPAPQHGSKAATSSSGSADLLISLGCTLTFPPAELPTILARTPFLFLFAPHYHPALAHIAPIRRQLNFRTVFNVLGPLINPAKPGRMVLGVAKRELGDTFARVLQILNVDRAMVVCGKEGLDEISPEGETWVWSLDRGVIEESTIHPTRDFGLPTHKLTAVRGATPELNAQTFRALLQPGSPVPAHLAHPADPADSPSIEAIRDFVLLNAAALLKTSGRAASYTEGVALARASLESGDAWRAFQAFVDASGDAMRSAGDDGAVEPEDDGGVAARGGSVEAWLHHEQQKKKEAEGK